MGHRELRLQVHTNFWVQRGSPTNRVREPRNKEPEDAEKKKIKVSRNKRVMHTRRDTTQV